MANGVTATGSVLAGISPQAQPDLAGSLLGGVQGRQNVLAGQQMAEQRQFNIDQAPQVAERQAAESEQRQQINQQQIGEADFNMAVQKARVENRLARQIRDLPLGERERFKQSLDPEMLQSLGIDPQQVAQVGTSDQALDDVIRQTDAALSAAGQGQATASQRDRQSLMQDLEGGVDPQTGQLKPEGELTARQRNAAVELGLLARPGTITGRERVAADEDATRRVAESEAMIEERTTRAREEAQNATGQAKEYFEQLESISGNIANYNQAIQALDEGANTGAVARRFPSVRAASVKLENAVNKLGLNVIQNTTFGALSEAELDFALRSAVPDNLPEDELRDFLVQTRDAQAKLADYLEGAIQFLSVPGNTLADLRATNPQGSGEREGGGQGSGDQNGGGGTQRIRFDAQGNMIQ